MPYRKPSDPRLGAGQNEGRQRMPRPKISRPAPAYPAPLPAKLGFRRRLVIGTSISYIASTSWSSTGQIAWTATEWWLMGKWKKRMGFSRRSPGRKTHA